MTSRQSRIYVVSDIHLGCNPPGALPGREQVLYQFLRNIPNQSTLILLGDIFEFWMEYRFYIPKMFVEFLHTLHHLHRDKDVKIFYGAGNHDFNLGNFFDQSCNIETFSDHLILTQENSRIYFTHGDGLAKSDVKYRILKRIIRHPLSNWLFKLLHPDWGMALALWVGNRSRNLKMGNKIPEKDYQSSAREKMHHHHCNVYVQGHTHRPQKQELEPNKCYINSGQWLFDTTYVKIENGIGEIMRWNSNGSSTPL